MSFQSARARGNLSPCPIEAPRRAEGVRAMRSLRTVFLEKFERLKQRFSAEIRSAESYERDRAHQATRGDRPFIGCSPCEPVEPRQPATVRENPAARPRS